MTTGLDISVLRAGAVLAPAALTGVLWLAAPTVRLRGAAFLAALWNITALLAINAMAVALGWRTFGTAGSMWSGVPVDVILGWALLWGAVPVLLMPWVRPLVSVAVLLAADVVAMRSLQPLVTLRADWWWGEALAVALSLVPAVVLGYLTAERRALRLRVGLQVVLFAALTFFLCPTVAFAMTGASLWAVRLSGSVDMVLVQLAAVVGIIALRAVADFATHGGTPFPWDPPERLVTVGPYAYVANPMQMCGVALLVILAGLLGQPALLLAAGIAAVFSAGIAGWNERDHLRDRFGDGWVVYRRDVRDWLPRWRPSSHRAPARLYVSVACDPCSDVGAWLSRRHPVALAIEDAESHVAQRRRIRYECDGTALDGTRALGAALEHLSLGYAMLGWVMRAPVLSVLVQLLADAVGAGPRTVSSRPGSSSGRR